MNPFERLINKIQPKKKDLEGKPPLSPAEEELYKLSTPSNELRRGYNLLDIFFNNYHRNGLEDVQELRAAIESCTNEELENLYESVWIKINGRHIDRPKTAGPEQDAFDKEDKKWAKFCDLVDTIPREVYAGRKK